MEIKESVDTLALNTSGFAATIVRKRFVEEGFYFLQLNNNNKKGCQEEHRSDIRHSAESVRVVWQSRNNHIKASTKEKYDDFIADKASKTPVTP
ncbi:unnamed protein product [Caenorhabditis brenneri]